MIDYTKLNEHIVEQAFKSLTKEQVDTLVNAKLERAKALQESREAFARGLKYATRK